MTLAGLFTGRDGYVITRHAGDTVVNILIDVDNHLKLLGKMKGFCCLVVRTKGFDYSIMIALARKRTTMQSQFDKVAGECESLVKDHGDPVIHMPSNPYKFRKILDRLKVLTGFYVLVVRSRKHTSMIIAIANSEEALHDFIAKNFGAVGNEYVNDGGYADHKDTYLLTTDNIRYHPSRSMADDDFIGIAAFSKPVRH